MGQLVFNKTCFIFILFCFQTSYCQTIPSEKYKQDLYWYHKDLKEDGVMGISLEKFHRTNFLKKKSKKIIVAVLDTQIDKTHPELKDKIWVNTKEIPNNGIDDDKNGYIDDVNGWSYTGDKFGGYIVWANSESVRVVRKYKDIFEGKTIEQVNTKDIFKYKEYQRALVFLKSKRESYSRKVELYSFFKDIYPIITDSLKKYFKKENISTIELDSLGKLKDIYPGKTVKDRRLMKARDIGSLAMYLSKLRELKWDYEFLKDETLQNDSILNKNYNIDYNERLYIESHPEKFEKGYGNGNMSNTKQGLRTIQNHSTMVSSIIAAKRSDTSEIYGFDDDIQIMPLNISPSGDEYDKDIALAIRYAVDNGAKVINMSIGKEFSTNQEWVTEALLYAQKKNVLVVKVAGNDKYDIDINPYYPTDYDYENKKELCNNFITVGSISNFINEKLISEFSNYGKENVDIFAPGDDIYVAKHKDSYGLDGGTSLAGPMVSGAAALIWLYYPKLTVQQVKKIILESGVSYETDVIVPGTKDKKVKFSELSKSGKILNVYNAMEMAKEVSKRK